MMHFDKDEGLIGEVDTSPIGSDKWPDKVRFNIPSKESKDRYELAFVHGFRNLGHYHMAQLIVEEFGVEDAKALIANLEHVIKDLQAK
jgi:hypothetical protein